MDTGSCQASSTTSRTAATVVTSGAELELEIEALVRRTFCEILDSDPAATIPDLERLLERADRAGLAVQQSHILSVLGQARAEMGDLDAARTVHDRARRLYQELGNPTGVTLESVNLAFVAVLSADAAEARRLLGSLARRQAPFDHHVHACFTLFTFGRLARLEGHWARCLRAHPAALWHFEAGGIADGRLRRREREQDIERARQALGASTQAAAEREAANSSPDSDVAWAFDVR